MSEHTYEVIVGNIGTVHRGANFRDANGVYRMYVSASKRSLGRAAGESVTLVKDGEPHRDYMPPGQDEDSFENVRMEPAQYTTLAPLAIEMLLQHHYSGRKVEIIDSPFHRSTLQQFLETGMLRPWVITDCFSNSKPEDDTREYVLTERGTAHVNALCALPLPPRRKGTV